MPLSKAQCCKSWYLTLLHKWEGIQTCCSIDFFKIECFLASHNSDYSQYISSKMANCSWSVNWWKDSFSYFYNYVFILGWRTSGQRVQAFIQGSICQMKQHTCLWKNTYRVLSTKPYEFGPSTLSQGLLFCLIRCVRRMEQTSFQRF